MRTFKYTEKITKVSTVVAIFGIAGELYDLLKFLFSSSYPAKTLKDVIIAIVGGIIVISCMKPFQEKTAKRIFLYFGIWCFSDGMRYIVHMTSKIWGLMFLSHCVSIAFGVAVFIACLAHLKYLKNRPLEILEEDKKDLEEDTELRRQQDKAMAITYTVIGIFSGAIGLFNLYRAGEFPKTGSEIFGDFSKYIIANAITLIVIMTVLIKAKLKLTTRTIFCLGAIALFGIVNVSISPVDSIEIYSIRLGLPCFLLGIFFWLQWLKRYKELKA